MGLLVIGAVALAGLLALLLWPQGRGPAEAEAFRSFRNFTGFADEEVWTAYRFALANPGDILNYIPCSCGCVYHGDGNNRDCYINGFDPQGRPVWDPHAAG